MPKTLKPAITPRKVLLLDPDVIQRLLRRRRAWGGDRYDEVWDGVYVMAPFPNPEHQDITTYLSSAFIEALGRPPQVRVHAGTNISDHEEKWEKNFRCPDVAVFLEGNPAQKRETHWLGGPDFAVEVISRGERARKKLPFYAKLGVRELLLVDRQPWALELYRRQGEELVLAAKGTPGDAEAIASEMLGLNFRLLTAEPRPSIEVVHPGDWRSWLV